jgi:hypothetical protein
MAPRKRASRYSRQGPNQGPALAGSPRPAWPEGLDVRPVSIRHGPGPGWEPAWQDPGQAEVPVQDTILNPSPQASCPGPPARPPHGRKSAALQHFVAKVVNSLEAAQGAA